MDNWIKFGIGVLVVAVIAALTISIVSLVNSDEALDGVAGAPGASGADAGSSFSRNISTVEDFPPAVNGIISLLDGVTYVITTDIDLGTDRMILGTNTSLIGTYTGSCSLTSTVENGSLITATSSVKVGDITLSVNGTNSSVFDLVGDQTTTSLDWTNLNVVNSNVGTIQDYSNLILFNCAFLSTTGPLVVSGVTSTFALSQCLFTNFSNTTSIDIQATINRRFRVIYSSFVITGTAIGVENNSPSVDPESFIIDSCNFSGGSSTMIAGIDNTNNAARFDNNKGIDNSYVSGELYMNSNATNTVLGDTTNYFKVLGTTTASTDNNRYIATDNRLTNDATITRTYRVTCTLSFSSGNSETCYFGFYDSTLSAVRTQNITKAITSSVGGGGNVSFSAVINHVAGDYIEIHCRNATSSATGITVDEMDVIITEST